YFFFQAEDGIRDGHVTGVQTCALPIWRYTRAAVNDLLSRNGYAIEELRHVNPVGAAGWFMSSKVLRRSTLPAGPLNLFGRLVPRSEERRVGKEWTARRGAAARRRWMSS